MPDTPGTGNRAAAPRKRAAVQKPQKSPTSGIGRRRASARDDSSAAYQERRAEIRKAAGEVFKHHGFGGSTLGKVAQELDVDRATLYYYVGSKEELFDDVVSEAVRANVAVAEQILGSAATAPDKVHQLVTALMRSYAENYPFLYVYIQENLSHVGAKRSAWSKEMRALNARYSDIVTEVIQAGMDDGSIRRVAEPWVLAYGVLGIVAWTNRWFNPETTTIDAEQVGEAYAAMLLRGMLA